MDGAYDSWTPVLGKGTQELMVYGPAGSALRWLEFIEGGEDVSKINVRSIGGIVITSLYEPLPRFVPVGGVSIQNVLVEFKTGNRAYRIRWWGVDPV